MVCYYMLLLLHLFRHSRLLLLRYCSFSEDCLIHKSSHTMNNSNTYQSRHSCIDINIFQLCAWSICFLNETDKQNAWQHWLFRNKFYEERLYRISIQIIAASAFLCVCILYSVHTAPGRFFSAMCQWAPGFTQMNKAVWTSEQLVEWCLWIPTKWLGAANQYSLMKCIGMVHSANEMLHVIGVT